MLVVSNVFMTIVWHGHLKHPQRSLGLVILARWGIAFFEYCLMVPANRWGSHTDSPFQLKIIQRGRDAGDVHRVCVPLLLPQAPSGIMSRPFWASSARWHLRFCRGSELRRLMREA